MKRRLPRSFYPAVLFLLVLPISINHGIAANVVNYGTDGDDTANGPGNARP